MIYVWKLYISAPCIDYVTPILKKVGKNINKAKWNDLQNSYDFM